MDDRPKERAGILKGVTKPPSSIHDFYAICGVPDLHKSKSWKTAEQKSKGWKALMMMIKNDEKKEVLKLYNKLQRTWSRKQARMEQNVHQHAREIAEFLNRINN